MRDRVSAARILVVEDEPQVAEVVGRYLERAGHSVTHASDGDGALEAFGRDDPDLIVLDLMIPGPDGFEVCEHVRKEGDTPVIILTARTNEVDRVFGLELGADDYVTKPFSPRELVARVTAVLRRSDRGLPSERLHAGPLMLDSETREVRHRDESLSLTALEFDLLWVLARQPRRVFTRDELLTEVWGADYEGDESTVTVHIRRLRMKIERDPSRPRHVQTVWGVGYRFEA